MEKYLANSDGKRHFEKVKKNIPSPYYNYVENIKYVRGGRVYERLLKIILEETLPGSKIDKPSAVFPMERGKTHGGYLLKKKYPKARYYVVIADLDIDGWTWSDDKEL